MTRKLYTDPIENQTTHFCENRGGRPFVKFAKSVNEETFSRTCFWKKKTEEVIFFLLAFDRRHLEKKTKTEELNDFMDKMELSLDNVAKEVTLTLAGYVTYIESISKINCDECWSELMASDQRDDADYLS